MKERVLLILLGLILITVTPAFIVFVIIPSVLNAMPATPPTTLEYYEIVICALGAIVFLILYFGRGSEEVMQ
jgi:hypothetical protein